MNNINNIKQSEINTFNRVGIDYKKLLTINEQVETINRFTGETIITTPLIAYLVGWVYKTSNQYEMNNYTVKLSDFDRIRYFILRIAPEVYNTCID